MKIFLADITSFNPANLQVVTWRFSSIVGFDDAGTFYAPRIENPATFTRAIGGQGFGGKGNTSFGELTLINNDGALNSMADHFFDGRTLTLRYGDDTIDDGINDGLGTLIPAPNASGFTTVLVAMIETVAVERERVSVRLRDRSITLDKPFSLAKFAGSNNFPYGIEGSPDDLKAQPKPRILGRVALMPPVLVNTSRLIYQVSHRPNFAAAVEGATATASSNASTAGKVLDGNRVGYTAGAADLWVATTGANAWLSITFPVARTIGEVHVYHIQNATTGSVEPYDGMTGSTQLVTGYRVETWDGNAWVTQDTITSNTAIKRVSAVTPVSTTAIRIFATAVAGTYMRLAEVEAYPPSAVDAILNVYDAGAYLSQATDYTSQADMETNAPANGCWRAWPAGGCFRLGSAPYGQVSASVIEKWDYVQTCAGILIQRILLEKGLTAADWVEADFTALCQKTESSLGVLVDGEETTASLIDRITQSVGAWWGFDSLNRFRIARLDAPSGTPVATFTDADIIELERQPDSQPAYWRTVLRYDRNYAVQDKKSLAGVVPADRVAWFEQEYREQVQETPSVKASRLLADEVKADTLLNSMSQAAAETRRRLDLFAARRDTVTLTVADPLSRYAAVDIGAVVNLTTTRLGYGSGKLFTVIGHAVDYQRNTLDLTLWG